MGNVDCRAELKCIGLRIAYCRKVFNYVDGSDETFTTDWEGICEINNLQKNSLDKDGNFVIRIGKFVDDKNC